MLTFNRRVILIPFLFSAFPVLSHAFDSQLVALAGDSMEIRVQDAVTDLKTETKKDVRKVKRKIRKATGHDSAKKDAVDHVNDTFDDLEGGIEKIGHH